MLYGEENGAFSMADPIVIIVMFWWKDFTAREHPLVLQKSK